MQGLQGQGRSRSRPGLAPEAAVSSYPSLGYPRYCSNSPLQVKGTYSAHIHRSRPCGFGNRSAGRPGEGRGTLRLGLSPRAAPHCWHGTGSGSPSAPRNSLPFALNRRFWGCRQREMKVQGKWGLPEPVPAQNLFQPCWALEFLRPLTGAACG